MMRKKILVISKSALTRSRLKKILKKKSFSVFTVKHLNELISVSLNNIDILIIDLEGFSFGELRALEKKVIKVPKIVFLVPEDWDRNHLLFETFRESLFEFIRKTNLDVVDEKRLLDIVKQFIEFDWKDSSSNSVDKNLKLNSFIPSPEEKVILIGASTGGPRLIENIVRNLPENYPFPVCIAQHMPVGFTEKFAKRLNSLSKLKVVEAKDGEPLVPGKVIIAKSGWHLHFMRENQQVVCKLVPNIGRFFAPSVDEMFLSAKDVFDPKKIVAVLLTGIGDDGAEGMVVLKKLGAYTIAESEETAVVFGMPKEAIRRGGATKVLPFPKILEELISIGRQT